VKNQKQIHFPFPFPFPLVSGRSILQAQLSYVFGVRQLSGVVTVILVFDAWQQVENLKK
jgi:hypothetical protein